MQPSFHCLYNVKSDFVFLTGGLELVLASKFSGEFLEALTP